MSPNLKEFAGGHWGKRSALFCSRCQTAFHGREAYKRHLVQYTAKQGGLWCHLPEEVGLVPGTRGWRLPAGKLTLDPAIVGQGGEPQFISRTISSCGGVPAPALAKSATESSNG